MSISESTKDFSEFLQTCLEDQCPRISSLISQFRIEFQLDDKSNCKVFRAIVGQRQIIIGQKGAERLWAHAYGYATVFYGTESTVRQVEVPIGEEQISRQDTASQLLTWSVQTEMALNTNKSEIVADFPAFLPSPYRISHDKVTALAQSLWLHALCFILLHEVAHISLNHSTEEAEKAFEDERDPRRKAELLEEANALLAILEKDADREAAEWLLRDTPQTEQRKLERTFGVATALLYLATKNVYMASPTGLAAPPGYDRLFQIIEQHFSDPGNEDSEGVWAFVSICLFLHLHTRGTVSLEDSFTGTWRQIADRLVNVLADRS